MQSYRVHISLSSVMEGALVARCMEFLKGAEKSDNWRNVEPCFQDLAILKADFMGLPKQIS